ILVTFISNALRRPAELFPYLLMQRFRRAPERIGLAAKPRALAPSVAPRGSLERRAQLGDRAPAPQIGKCLRVTNGVGGDGSFADALGLVDQSRGQHSLRTPRDAPGDFRLW